MGGAAASALKDTWIRKPSRPATRRGFTVKVTRERVLVRFRLAGFSHGFPELTGKIAVIERAGRRDKAGFALVASRKLINECSLPENFALHYLFIAA